MNPQIHHLVRDLQVELLEERGQVTLAVWIVDQELGFVVSMIPSPLVPPFRDLEAVESEHTPPWDKLTARGVVPGVQEAVEEV